MRVSRTPLLTATLLLASLGFSAVSLAETKAFKCTAASGDITYLDTRPTTGCVKIEEVRVNVGRGSSGEDKDAAAGEGDKDAVAAGDDKEITQRKEQQKKDCELQRKNLEILKTKTYIQVKDEDGKVHPITPEDQQKRIHETEQHIADFCS